MRPGSWYVFISLSSCNMHKTLSTSLFSFVFSFSPSGNFRNFVRLSFALVEEDEIEEGIRNMGAGLNNFLKH